MNTPHARTFPARLEVLMVLMFTVAVLLVYTTAQPRTTIGGGRGYDGEIYGAMADQIAAGQPLTDSAPFVYRPGVSWLVGALFPHNIDTGFMVVNVAACLVLMALWVLWLRLYVPSVAVRFVLYGAFVLQWFNFIRLLPWIPVQIDPVAACMFMAGLLVLRTPGRWQIAALAVIVFVGVLVRETLIIIAIASLFTSTKRNFIPLAAGLSAVLLTHVTGHSTSNYSFAGSVINWMYAKSVPLLLHALLIAYFPFVIFLLLDWRAHLDWLKSTPWAGAIVAIVVVLTYIGGSDTERFFYWLAPMAYVLIGSSLSRRRINRLTWATLIALAIVSERVAFLLVPGDPTPAFYWPILTKWADARYLDLVTLTMPPVISFVLLAEQVLCLCALALLVRRTTRS